MKHRVKTADPFDKYLLIRKKERPRARDLIPQIFDRFLPYSEGFPQDLNVIGGYAELEGQPVFVIGQNWHSMRGNKILATVTANGYSLALRIMRLAEKHQRPLITLIDIPGGDPLKESAKLLQCWKISECISTLAGLRVPTMSVIIGEGGSGGALAFQVADRCYMLENSVFSIISPEGCSSILFKGFKQKSREEKERGMREVAQLLRPTALDMLELNVIDGIITEPAGGAHKEYEETAKNIRKQITQTMQELKRERVDLLLARRYKRYLSYGEWQELPVEPKVSLIQKIAFRIKDGTRKIFKKKKRSDFEEPHEVEVRDKDQKKFYACINKECGAKTPFKAYLKNHKVCPKCGGIDRKQAPRAIDWIHYLVDRGSFKERDGNLAPMDPLDFRYRTDGGGLKTYIDAVRKDRAKTGANEALIIGTAKIKGMDVVLAVSEYGFRSGSLSSVVGEKFVRAVKYANQRGCPLISVCMSGGARMQEGILSLLQMVKTNMALTRLKVPYISILGDPTMAGSLSSYVSRGDVHIAEENAEIGFAGTRVVEGYLRTRIRDKEGKSPEWYYPGFYLKQGGINEIVTRKNMRDRVSEYLEFLIEF